MDIREPKRNDIIPLSKLMRAIIRTSPYYSRKAKSEEIKKHGPDLVGHYLGDRKYYLCLIAEENKRLAGFVIGRNEAGVFWTDWLGVEKRMRRSGVAGALMMALEARLGRGGVHKIWCDTRTSNREANRLVAKLKYKKLGKFRNGWYRQDFFLWEKDLV